MSNTQEFHVSLLDSDYQVARFVAESTTMSNVYAGAINLIDRNNKGLKSDEYWVDVRDTSGKYLTRVKYENKEFQVGFLSKDSVLIEWHPIDEHHILNHSYQFEIIKSL